ncbi:MAG TPA: hypothetical protein PLS28_04330, partial [Clostridiales bacterium]|nr:hypothetical protein [Clostridiales bacterium]
QARGLVPNAVCPCNSSSFTLVAKDMLTSSRCFFTAFRLLFSMIAFRLLFSMIVFRDYTL